MEARLAGVNTGLATPHHYGLIVTLLPVCQTLLNTLSIFTLKILQAFMSILFQQL